MKIHILLVTFFIMYQVYADSDSVNRYHNFSATELSSNSRLNEKAMKQKWTSQNNVKFLFDLINDYGQPDKFFRIPGRKQDQFMVYYKKKDSSCIDAFSLRIIGSDMEDSIVIGYFCR